MAIVIGRVYISSRCIRSGSLAARRAEAYRPRKASIASFATMSLSDSEDERFVKFPSIGHLKNLHKEVKYVQIPEEFQVDSDTWMVDYVGTVKLHGSNCSIVSRVGELLQFQSRNQIVTQEHDTTKFTEFCRGKVDTLEHLFGELRGRLPNSHTIAVYGEFCGRGIHKGVGISKIEPSWIIFNVKVLSAHPGSMYWEWAPPELWSDLRDEQGRIYNIFDYPTYKVRINLLRPEESIDETQKMAEEIGRDCPVARAIGSPGGGEGIVWIPGKINNSRLWFKSKSEAHSVTSALPNPAKANRARPSADRRRDDRGVKSFVEENVTESRLEGSRCRLHELGLSMEKKNLGKFLQNLVADVIQEEGGDLSDEDLKSARKMLSERGRIWYLSYLEREGI